MGIWRINVEEGRPRVGRWAIESYSSTLSLTSALDDGRWLTTRHIRFTSGNDLVSNAQRDEWAAGCGLKTWGKYRPHRVSNSHLQARSNSLCRLSYLGPRRIIIMIIIIIIILDDTLPCFR